VKVWKLLAIWSVQEGVLFSEVHVEKSSSGCATIGSDDIVTGFVFLFPCIDVMEDHMGWKLKPFYVFGIFAISFEDSVS
jgi:hypothetical protein